MKEFEEMTNEELALLYVGGNFKAFDELLARTQSKIFSYIIFIVHDEEVANEIFQETYVRVISRLQRGVYTDNGKFNFWLNRVAHNCVMDWYRSLKSSRIVDLSYENDLTKIKGTHVTDTFRERDMICEQVISDVRRLVKELPPTQREAIFLHFYQKLTYREIAELTGVSINTALGRVRYAIHNLRKMIKEHNIELALDSLD